MKCCKNCRYSTKLKELSPEYRLCKIDNEIKFVNEYCINHKRKDLFTIIYDYVIFLLFSIN